MSIITANKKAYRDYEILETFEAGITLTGPEVKSVKNSQIKLTGGYVTIGANNSVWLINVHIAPYPPAGQIQQNYDPAQNRKLLLRKKEIISLIGKTKIKGLTLVPLKVYARRGLIKIEIGLARGKKKWDKRKTIKEREVRRKIERALKG